MNDSHQKEKLRDAFKTADAIFQLEGYDSDAFEQQQKERVVRSEITTEELIQIMREYFRRR
ncbi:antitoxin VbhA family protein [Burkholderia sp. L27(2015)]|uniref:antitoxin VbhA family protein n=1 Tax=Burkholderia sp. L27(2015) TaxID=1641858 RepID=UPI0020B12C27|nr:antitoxin VbhA family protein [Burkholderia sp. L27(2015)]